MKNRIGETKAVDENGEPLLLWHSTKEDFNAFADRTTYFSDNLLWGSKFGEVAWGCHLWMNNPLFVINEGMDFETLSGVKGYAYTPLLNAEGFKYPARGWEDLWPFVRSHHDGLIIRNKNQPTIYVVLRRRQIVPVVKYRRTGLKLPGMVG